MRKILTSYLLPQSHHQSHHQPHHQCRRQSLPGWLALMASVLCVCSLFAEEKSPEPQWKQQWQQQARQHRESRSKAVEKLSLLIAENPTQLDAYSRRGDLYLFLGEAEKAVADYDRMVELSPPLDKSHWRRGIALYYAGKFKEAAAQFDRYHSFDDVDRENGIWRYLSHYRAYGKKKARQELLKYEKDDREPFPSVYKLFAGEITPAQIIEKIQSADLTETQREQRMFYATLYIGLNHVVAENPKAARLSLQQMLPNQWGPTAGYGPSYMWEVGRLQWELLQAEHQTSEEAEGMGTSNSKSINE